MSKKNTVPRKDESEKENKIDRPVPEDPGQKTQFPLENQPDRNPHTGGSNER